jgi:hypothetical protein
MQVLRCAGLRRIVPDALYTHAGEASANIVINRYIAAPVWHVSVEDETHALSYIGEGVAAERAIVGVVSDNSVARKVGEMIIDDLGILQEVEGDTAAIEG